MFKGVKRVLCVGIDKRCSYAFLLILYGFLLSTKMTTPEMKQLMQYDKYRRILYILHNTRSSFHAANILLVRYLMFILDIFTISVNIIQLFYKLLWGIL
ncbi:hypothetical protein C817_04407 [Dorea sp. 5-2]|nr:hypothetical protein C817_04407 [Dorea sp. 5-2]